MDSTREGLYCKAMSIVSTVYGIMLWASSFPSPPPMQTTTTTREESSFVTPKYQFSFGINTLIYLGKEMPRSPNNNGRPRILHSSMIRSPSSLSSLSSSSSLSSCSSLFPGTIHTDSSLSSWSSWSSSSLTGDLIGSESGVYTSPDEDLLIANEEMERSSYSERRYGGRSSSSRVKQRNQHRYEKEKEKEKEEYPPSIPSLARTGNLPGRSSMPWVLTRHYIDGRLIFKMEKVKRREYFKADRSDSGRLVLKLVPLDDDTVSTCCHHENNWQGGEIEDDDLNLIEEEENNNKTDSEEEEEEMVESNGDVDVDRHGREDEVYYEGVLEKKVVDGASHSHSQERKKTMLMTSSFASCSVPKSCRENRWGNDNGDEYGRLCFTYAGGKTGFDQSLILSHSAGSSPLSFGRIRPLASVV